MSKFYSNQIDAANKIYNHFIKGNKKVLLFAQMQSGKTGTYSCLIQKLKMNKDWKSLLEVEDIVVILADSNLAVKEQIRQDINDNDIRVFHRPDHKVFGEIKNSLIILDESHTAQNIKNIPGQYMKKHAETLKVLTVSATDFHNGKTSDKNIPRVILSPGENYYGVVKMLENGLVERSTTPYERNKLTPMFMNVLDSLVDRPKYSIIRVGNDTMSRKLKSLIIKSYPDVLTKIVNSKENNNDMNLSFLQEIPKKSTIVIINGAARMGRQINTSNVALVWDTAKSDTDTSVQSLAGRCCGYNKEKDSVRIFTDLDQVRKYATIVKNNFNMDTAIFDTNISNQKRVLSEFAVPIKIQVKKFPKTKKERNSFIKTLPVIKGLLSKYSTKDVGTIRDLAKLTVDNGPERRLDLLNAIDKGNSYGYGVSKGRMFGISIDTRYGEVFIMERLNLPNESVIFNRRAESHHELLNNKRGV